MRCPYCYSRNLVRFGIYRYGKKPQQRWICLDCRGTTIAPLARKPRTRRRRS